MKLKNGFEAQFDARKINALIRTVGEAWPKHIPNALREAFAEQEETVGCRELLAVVEGQAARLFVLTFKAEADTRSRQKALNDLYARLAACKAEGAVLHLCGRYTYDERVQIAKTLQIAPYQFTAFRTSGISTDLSHREEMDFAPESWTVVMDGDKNETDAVLGEAEILAGSVLRARELVNRPANDLTPTRLAEEAVKEGRASGFEVEVFGPDYIQEKGMQAFWSVAKGSDEEPRLIVMRYHNNPDSKEILALVGKGLCYDSGGYAIKPADGMVTMFADMGGSAAVIGAIRALARKGAKVNVTAIVAACENMVSGHAYRNGDIIGSMAGKNIEVVNTDAEGRLTLADAVTYAWKVEKCTAITDIATLTGACGIALGEDTVAVITDRDSLYEGAQKASRTCGEKVWRLPYDDEFEALNASERADIKNSGGRPAGTISAGLFIRAFAGQKPFMHFDIAWTAYRSKASGRDPKGATGSGVELLYYVAQDHFRS